MADSSAFQAYDKTYLLTTAALNCIPTAGSNPTPGTLYSFRIRNITSAVAYFTWGGNNTVTSVGAPSGGSPSTNTIGMFGNSVETFRLAGNWFISSVANAFEVTPGEGV